MLCAFRDAAFDYDRAYDTYSRIGCTDGSAIVYSADSGSCIGPNALKDLDLFLEKHLKGREIYIPKALNISLAFEDGTLRADVEYDEGGILWTQRGGENFAAFTIFSVVTALFALGSLLPSENTDELLISLALPSSFAAGIIAVIVLLVLLQADDCSCDCCDGGDCTDCCDCSPDFGQRRPKHTTMSDLSGPANP